MTRIVLQYPIMRHYAGSVFDLEDNILPEENFFDERNAQL